MLVTVFNELAYYEVILNQAASVRENVVSHSKNVKSRVFLDFEKNVKKRKKTYVDSQAT